MYFCTSFYYILLNNVALFYGLICLTNAKLIQIYYN
nr:MAG TPA: hypothetical protein [Bacteriophage sp.]